MIPKPCQTITHSPNSKCASPAQQILSVAHNSKHALERQKLPKTSGCGCSIIRSVQASADSDSSNPVLWLAFFSVFILQIQAYFNGVSLSFLISFAARGEESIPKPSQLLSCMARRQTRVICPVTPWSSCDTILEKVASIEGQHASTAKRTCLQRCRDKINVANKCLFLAPAFFVGASHQSG